MRLKDRRLDSSGQPVADYPETAIHEPHTIVEGAGHAFADGRLSDPDRRVATLRGTAAALRADAPALRVAVRGRERAPGWPRPKRARAYLRAAVAVRRHRCDWVYKTMRARGKAGNVTVVAAARELSCFLWAAATAD